MDIIRTAIEKPVAVLVGVILVVLFGLIALYSLPYQLTPSVTQPEITVETTWSGATPYEIERDVIEEQEKVLKGIPGLVEMESSCYNGLAELSLTFKLGTDLESALLRVSNKLDEVPDYPDDVDKPIIEASGSSTSPIIWMILKARDGETLNVQQYRTYLEDEITQHLERVNGVSGLFMGGGVEEEMHVVVDPRKLAAYNLTIPKLMDVLRNENISISAGNLGVGRRDYRIRTPADLNTPEMIENVVITSSGQFRVRLKDVGTVKKGYEKAEVAMIHNNKKGIAVGVEPEPGANVLEVTDAVFEVVEWLNSDILSEEGIYFDWVHDERPYINGSIDLVQQNIIIGGVLAIVVLFVFLQSMSATVIVALAIPISIIGAFIIFGAAGRTLNVVSMAGISFAVGMLVDNAIVVLENIDRHRGMGKRSFQAAYEGTKEVWGAVLASTLTTVAVFLPVVFMEQEAGQLFKDISIAVTCAIFLSLFVSVLVIPMFARYLYGFAEKRNGAAGPDAGPRDPVGKKIAGKLLTPLTNLGGKGADWLMGLLRLSLRDWKTQVITVVGLTLTSILMVLVFFPKMEYLPQGNSNLVLNILIPPPGLSYQERFDIGKHVFKETEPYFGKEEVNGVPGVAEMFYVSSPTIHLFGAVSTQEERAGEMTPLFNRMLNSIPGMFGVSIQSSIFDQGIGEGRNISVDISGANLEQIVAAAGTMFGMSMQQIPGAQIRPIPSLELLYPEVRFEPKRDRIRAAGLSTRDLAESVDVILDGRQVGDYKAEGKKKIDMVLMASEEDISTPEALSSALVATPQGWAVPLSSLADVKRTYGLNQIRHLERQRTVTLQITPPAEMPLQEAMEIVEQKMIPAVKGMGLLEGLQVRMSGAADKLTVTREALQWNFLLAVIITYLLMAALFENFLYPFIILFTVPLAGAGGFLGLKLENWFIAYQPMDILTMLGFVILIGVVVNNAILIVHQSLNNVREGGMEHRKAILEATRTRLRPIYMSATTSIFGMLPLAVAPGPGSELYRGLGAVVLGGLALSTVFTVFVIPSLLMFFIKMEKVGGKKAAV